VIVQKPRQQYVTPSEMNCEAGEATSNGILRGHSSRMSQSVGVDDVAIELTDEAKELLVEKGCGAAMGARPLRRAIRRVIEDPLADFALGRSLEPGSTILVAAKGDTEDVDVTVIPGEVTPEKITLPPEQPSDAADEELSPE
jgi:ATP-dependent Clp protease ATP-binding subunit ClpC